MRIFALEGSEAFGRKVADTLGVTLAEHETREFDDGEHKSRPLVSVRNRDVYVIQSLYGDSMRSVDDRVCRLLFFLATVRDAGARRVCAVVPYLAYARKDRQTKQRDPVTTRHMALLLEAMGIDALMTLEVHNVVALQNAFRCRVHHLESGALFGPHVAARLGAGPIVVTSPDPGGVKRAQLFQESLEARVGRPVDFAFIEKRRSAGILSGHRVVGDVDGATVLVVDDMIATGATMLRAAGACRSAGAKEVLAIAAHGLFVGDAAPIVAHEDLSGWIVSDTVPPLRLDEHVAADHLETVSAAPLFARAIRHLHEARAT